MFLSRPAPSGADDNFAVAFCLLACLALVLARSAHADAPIAPTLSLEDAERLALAHQPVLARTQLEAEVQDAIVAEERSAYLPTLSANLTGAAAFDDTVVTAGALTTSSLSTRAAGGLSVSQLITDFGRTINLTRAARLRAQAQHAGTKDARALTLLAVRRAYYAALAATAVEKVAQETLADRRLTLRQVTALAESQLKSPLDVHFAEAASADAELAVVQAQSGVREAQAELAVTLGTDEATPFTLVDDMRAPTLSPDPEALVAQAWKLRPDLLALGLEVDAATHFASAESELNYPTLVALGTVGATPWHDPTVAHDYYGAAGLNLSIPLIHGGLYQARADAATLQAHARAKALEDLRDRIGREVRVDWARANSAYQRIDVTTRLLATSTQALRLAKARYDTGLGNFLEVSQSQILQSSAALSVATAHYDYLSSRAELDYATGRLQ